jgi:hypothetical protein
MANFLGGLGGMKGTSGSGLMLSLVQRSRRCQRERRIASCPVGRSRLLAPHQPQLVCGALLLPRALKTLEHCNFELLMRRDDSSLGRMRSDTTNTFWCIGSTQIGHPSVCARRNMLTSLPDLSESSQRLTSHHRIEKMCVRFYVPNLSRSVCLLGLEVQFFRK